MVAAFQLLRGGEGEGGKRTALKVVAVEKWIESREFSLNEQ